MSKKIPDNLKKIEVKFCEDEKTIVLIAFYGDEILRIGQTVLEY